MYLSGLKNHWLWNMEGGHGLHIKNKIVIIMEENLWLKNLMQTGILNLKHFSCM